MKTVSIINLKGGTGKTLTTVNMAAILASEYQQRVLVVDADPQGNASRFFGVSAQAGGLAELMGGLAVRYDDVTYPAAAYPNVRVLPSDMGLLELDADSLLRGGRRYMRTLMDLRDAVAADGAADVILIDCPPSFTAASMAAIAASTGVIIPIKLDAWALAGMRELSAQIDSLRMVNEYVRVDGCLITQWHNSEVIRQAEGRLRAGAWPVYSTVIRRTDKADESTFASMALSDYSRWSSAARDYRAFVAEWLERGGVSSGRQV